MNYTVLVGGVSDLRRKADGFPNCRNSQLHSTTDCPADNRLRCSTFPNTVIGYLEKIQLSKNTESNFSNAPCHVTNTPSQMPNPKHANQNSKQANNDLPSFVARERFVANLRPFFV